MLICIKFEQSNQLLMYLIRLFIYRSKDFQQSLIKSRHLGIIADPLLSISNNKMTSLLENANKNLKNFLLFLSISFLIPFPIPFVLILCKYKPYKNHQPSFFLTSFIGKTMRKIPHLLLHFFRMFSLIFFSFLSAFICKCRCLTKCKTAMRKIWMQKSVYRKSTCGKYGE